MQAANLKFHGAKITRDQLWNESIIENGSLVTIHLFNSKESRISFNGMNKNKSAWIAQINEQIKNKYQFK